MHIALEILTIMLTAVTMSLALAHALELPGKLRLSKEEYLTVQAIYYPGFTFGGFAEFGSIIAALALLILTPVNSPQFWLVTGGLAALAAVQVIFWTMTQPVNKYWLANTELSRGATRFFETGSAARPGDWVVMRDTWERFAYPSRHSRGAGLIAADMGCRVVISPRVPAHLYETRHCVQCWRRQPALMPLNRVPQ